MSEYSENKWFYMVKPENNLIIRNADEWYSLWHQVVAYYWAVENDPLLDEVLHEAITNAQINDDHQSPNILFYILNRLGVKNMMLVADESRNRNTSFAVALLPFEAPDEKLKEKLENLFLHQFDQFIEELLAQAYPYPYILKVKIADSLPSPDFNMEQALLGDRNGWTNVTGNLAIVIPPKKVQNQLFTLSNYISFKGFMPFARTFSLPYEDASEDDVRRAYALPNTTIKHYVQPRCGEDDMNALEKRMEQFAKLQMCQIDTLPDKVVDAELPRAKVLTPLKQDELTPGDRGGASGVTGDYAWMEFVPKMISYNWNKDTGTIKNGSLLANYTVMLNGLGYVVPKGLNVELRYAQKIPELSDLKSLQQYSCVLEVLIPEAPSSQSQPIALANLVAKRANAPFTCA